MTLTPKYELRGAPNDETVSSAEPPVPSASWSGYPAPNHDALIGQTLNGTYVVEGVIGEGGMGRVYRASHTRISNKRFAIKVLRPEFTRNIEVVTRFRREAEAAACISHPNVVEVYDVDITPDGYSYLVCEFLAGLDLADYLTKVEHLTPARAVNMVLQVCHALTAAHNSGVIHRDIKPHNIFLLANEQGVIPEYPATKVLDFGLSRFMDSDGTTQLTRAGVIMGTPAYMSPEQAEGRSVDARTDIYGLGAVLYATLAGRPPFEAESLQALVMAVINGEPAPLRRVCPDVPESLDFIVERAMARSPDERYQSMQEFRSALENYFAKVALNTMPPTAPIRLPAPSLVQEPGDQEIAAARPKLVAYSTLLTLLIVFGLTTCVSSIEVVTGRWKLSRLELLLLFFGLIGTLLTPALLLFAKVKKTIWTSHAKVLGLLSQLRAATLTTILSYGATTLFLLVADDVVARWNGSTLLGHPLGTGFRGFNVVYFAIAAIWVGVTAYLTSSRSRHLGRLVTISVLALGSFGSALLIGGGLQFRAHHDATLAKTTKTKTATTLSATASIFPDVSASTQTQTESPPPAKAPAQELAAASLKGTVGLLPLSERYPEDPNVLRPLLYSFASRATGLLDAISVAARLLRVSPTDAVEPDLRYLVRKAATTPGQASQLAFDIMSEQMGSTGADLLYDLMLSEPKVAKTAEQLLMKPQVTASFSPALAIAYELRKAKSCADRLPLLERAAGLGDKRSVAILYPLSASSKHGCGKWKRSPCPAACPEEAAAYMQTVTQILGRQSTTR
jgi:serine/threonine-protein kinase